MYVCMYIVVTNPIYGKGRKLLLGKQQYMLTETHTHIPAPLWGQWLVGQWHSAREQSSLFGEDDSAQEQHQPGSLSLQSFSHRLTFERQLGSPGAWVWRGANDREAIWGWGVHFLRLLSPALTLQVCHTGSS